MTLELDRVPFDINRRLYFVHTYVFSFLTSWRLLVEPHTASVYRGSCCLTLPVHRFKKKLDFFFFLFPSHTLLFYSFVCLYPFLILVLFFFCWCHLLANILNHGFSDVLLYPSSFILSFTSTAYVLSVSINLPSSSNLTSEDHRIAGVLNVCHVYPLLFCPSFFITSAQLICTIFFFLFFFKTVFCLKKFFDSTTKGCTLTTQSS